MYSFVRKLYIVFFFVSLLSCRSSKQTVTFQEESDTIAASLDVSLCLHQDSSIKTETTISRVCGVVEFIESGGSISVVADGSVLMSGVSAMQSSRFDASAGKEENSNSSLQTQKKDFISVSSKEKVHSEFEVKESNSRRILKKSVYISFIFILVLIIILVKIRRTRL